MYIENAPLSILVYVPKAQAVIFLQDGDGSQLMSEDREAGYNAYVDYKINKYVGDDQLFAEDDGGLYMYDNSKVNCWTDMIEAAICDALSLDSNEHVEIIYMGSGDVTA